VTSVKPWPKPQAKIFLISLFQNTFSDVAGLIGKAEKARQNAIYEEGAPMRARQARMQQELERNKNERIAELEKGGGRIEKSTQSG
jgi:hypothetical protein